MEVSEKRKRESHEEDVDDNESHQETANKSARPSASVNKGSPGKRPKLNDGKASTSVPKSQKSNEEITETIDEIVKSLDKTISEKLHHLMLAYDSAHKWIPKDGEECKDDDGNDGYRVALHLTSPKGEKGNYLVEHAPAWESPVCPTLKEAKELCAAEAINWCRVSQRFVLSFTVLIRCIGEQSQIPLQ